MDEPGAERDAESFRSLEMYPRRSPAGAVAFAAPTGGGLGLDAVVEASSGAPGRANWLLPSVWSCRLASLKGGDTPVGWFPA